MMHLKGLLASVIDEAEVKVINFGPYARVPTLVAQRLGSEAYESPALPLSYSAAAGKFIERDPERQPRPKSAWLSNST
jgi:hypothetical protein